MRQKVSIYIIIIIIIRCNDISLYQLLHADIRSKDNNVDNISGKEKEPITYDNHDMDIYDDQSDNAENAMPDESENMSLDMNYAPNEDDNVNNEVENDKQSKKAIIISVKSHKSGKVGRIQTSTGGMLFSRYKHSIILI
jgi:hypothetical protein